MTESLLSLDLIGLHNVGKIFRNLSPERLIEEGILNNEVKIGMNGATIVDTGAYTGRSPKDKYFVEENSSKDNLWWGPINRPVSEEVFNELFEKVLNYYNSGDSKTYIFDGFAGADKETGCLCV